MNPDGRFPFEVGSCQGIFLNELVVTSLNEFVADKSV